MLEILKYDKSYFRIKGYYTLFKRLEVLKYDKSYFRIKDNSTLYLNIGNPIKYQKLFQNQGQLLCI